MVRQVLPPRPPEPCKQPNPGLYKTEDTPVAPPPADTGFGAYGHFIAGLPVRNMMEAVTATGRATLNDMLAQLAADTDGPIV